MRRSTCTSILIGIPYELVTRSNYLLKDRLQTPGSETAIPGRPPSSQALFHDEWPDLRRIRASEQLLELPRRHPNLHPADDPRGSPTVVGFRRVHAAAPADAAAHDAQLLLYWVSINVEEASGYL